jgi:hypothetical protein
VAELVRHVVADDAPRRPIDHRGGLRVHALRRRLERKREQRVAIERRGAGRADAADGADEARALASQRRETVLRDGDLRGAVACEQPEQDALRDDEDPTALTSRRGGSRRMSTTVAVLSTSPPATSAGTRATGATSSIGTSTSCVGTPYPAPTCKRIDAILA